MSSKLTNLLVGALDFLENIFHLDLGFFVSYDLDSKLDSSFFVGIILDSKTSSLLNVIDSTLMLVRSKKVINNEKYLLFFLFIVFLTNIIIVL